MVTIFIGFHYYAPSRYLYFNAKKNVTSFFIKAFNHHIFHGYKTFNVTAYSDSLPQCNATTTVTITDYHNVGRLLIYINTL